MNGRVGGVAISVLVLMYEPDIKKMLQTLYSVIRQKNIIFEIVICDDASKIDLSMIIKDFFKEKGFTLYSIVRNNSNVGTVNNCLNGVNAAKGKYIYLISPGDFLYDEYVLEKMYSFASSNNIDFCFGDVQSYSAEGRKITLKKFRLPSMPWIYSNFFYVSWIAKLWFLLGQQVIGCAYLRKTTIMKKYLERISDRIIYLEDAPTSIMYLLDGEKLVYFKSLVVWYEYGNGITTSNSSLGNSRIRHDYETMSKVLLEYYPNNGYASAFFGKSGFLPLIVGICEIAMKIMKKIFMLMGRNAKIEELKKILLFDENNLDDIQS